MTGHHARASRHRRAWLAFAGFASLLVLLLLAAGLVGRPSRGGGPAVGTQGQASYRRGVWLLLDAGEQRHACRSGAEHYRYVVVQWYARHDRGCPLERIKSANPHARVLAYQNLGAMIGGPHPDGRPSTCVTQEEADAHDRAARGDSWHLHDPAGNVLAFRDEYPFLQPANVGRASFQRACARRLARIAADGYDGVLADDVNVAPGHRLGEGGGTPIAEYPTDAAYGEAVVEAFRGIGAVAERWRLPVVPNVAADLGVPQQRARALALARAGSGLFWEFWTRQKGGGPGIGGADWDASVAFAEAVQRLGRPFLANTYQGPGPEGAAADQQYAAATFWLSWDGRQDSGWGYDVPGDPVAGFSSAWGPDLGAPLDPGRVRVGAGWRRRYAGGVAIANPSRSQPQRFDLGARYRRPDGSPAGTVVLPPLSGMVLVAGGRG